MEKKEINESVIMKALEWAYDKAVTSFYNSNEFVEWCFKEAEKYFSDNELVINDTSNNTWIHGNGTNRAKYYMQIEHNGRPSGHEIKER